MSNQKLSGTLGTKSILNQQIQQLSYTIQIKQKKIIYLQQQIRLIKEQYTRKLQKVEEQYERIRKQNQFIQRKMIDQKQLSGKQWGQKIKQIHQQSRLNTAQKQQFYQNLIKQKQIKSLQLITDFQSRYNNIIKQLKQENQILQNKLINKQTNILNKKQQIVMTFGKIQNKFLSQQDFVQNQSQTPEIQNRAQLMKEKLSFIQEIFTLKQKCEKLTKQLESQKRLSRKLECEADHIRRQYQEKISLLKFTIEKLQEKVQTFQDQKNGQKSQYEQKITDLQEQNQQLRVHLKQSDQTYLKLLQVRTTQQIPQPLTTIKSCNHARLISQMEKNLQLKNNEIATLKEKVIEWERIFGFDKNIDQRLSDLGNVSNRTQKVYRNQKERLVSQTDKISKKGIRSNK